MNWRTWLNPARRAIYPGTGFAIPLRMAIVLISWVSMSMFFCLALVRAAARRYLLGTTPAETETLTPQPAPAVSAAPAMREHRPAVAVIS
ncbi:MAG TPA: hypothetical protein VKY92_11815 [Verrucomicrobiae bacterium]|nr:hypothetical protein [Verrucomicrobiae bacterium]